MFGRCGVQRQWQASWTPISSQAVNVTDTNPGKHTIDYNYVHVNTATHNSPTFALDIAMESQRLPTPQYSREVYCELHTSNLVVHMYSEITTVQWVRCGGGARVVEMWKSKCLCVLQMLMTFNSLETLCRTSELWWTLTHRLCFPPAFRTAAIWHIGWRVTCVGIRIFLLRFHLYPQAKLFALILKCFCDSSRELRAIHTESKWFSGRDL